LQSKKTCQAAGLSTLRILLSTVVCKIKMKKKILFLFLTTLLIGWGQEITISKSEIQKKYLIEMNQMISKDELFAYIPYEFLPIYHLSNSKKNSNSIFLTQWLNTDENGDFDTVKVFSQIYPNEYDTMKVNLASSILKKVDEAKLFLDNSFDINYRFTWIRSLDSKIYIIRLTRDELGTRLIWKSSKIIKAENDEYEWVTNFDSLFINQENWEGFISYINKIDFWNMRNLGEFRGMDGSEWVLEGSCKKSYNVVWRYSPDDSSSYYKTCRFLINLTGLKIDEDRIY
jgi:hypothetical protein